MPSSFRSDFQRQRHRSEAIARRVRRRKGLAPVIRSEESFRKRDLEDGPGGERGARQGGDLLALVEHLMVGRSPVVDPAPQSPIRVKEDDVLLPGVGIVARGRVGVELEAEADVAREVDAVDVDVYGQARDVVAVAEQVVRVALQARAGARCPRSAAEERPFDPIGSKAVRPTPAKDRRGVVGVHSAGAESRRASRGCTYSRRRSSTWAHCSTPRRSHWLQSRPANPSRLIGLG